MDKIAKLLDEAQFTEISPRELASLTVEQQIMWLDKTGVVLRNWGHIGNISAMMEGKILYTVNKLWAELSTEATSGWEYEFMNWAIDFTRTTGRDPAPQTISNKMTVYRDIIAEPITKMPKTVTISHIDHDTGEVYTDEVPFDPMQVDYSRWLFARGTIARGELNREGWNLLADPNVPVKQLQSHLQTIRNGDRDGSNDLVFFAESGLIFARRGNEVSVLFSITESEGNNPELHQEGVRHILLAAGLKVEDIYKNHG